MGLTVGTQHTALNSEPSKLVPENYEMDKEIPYPSDLTLKPSSFRFLIDAYFLLMPTFENTCLSRGNMRMCVRQKPIQPNPWAIHTQVGGNGEGPEKIKMNILSLEEMDAEINPSRADLKGT